MQAKRGGDPSEIRPAPRAPSLPKPSASTLVAASILVLEAHPLPVPISDDAHLVPIEALRDRTRTVDFKQVNAVLLQPHWRHNPTGKLPAPVAIPPQPYDAHDNKTR